MAAKALFSLAALLAVSLGLLIPTPGAPKSLHQQSMIETMDVGR